MPEEETVVEDGHGTDEAAAGGGPTPDPTPTADQAEDESPRPPESDWPDLDGYQDALRAEAGWLERIGAVHLQLAELRGALLGIAAQQRLLGIAEDLERLNDLVLGGAAVAQSLRLGYGLERYLALFWPAALDPRPALVQPSSEGEYRVEVYLHLGPDGKGRIRVEGAKRLEAPLPTSRARLRGVLLRAIQEPKLVDPTAGSGEPPLASAGEAAPAPESEPAETPERPAGPRPGDADAQPPPEEQVIPLGPSEDDRPSGESETASDSG